MYSVRSRRQKYRRALSSFVLATAADKHRIVEIFCKRPVSSHTVVLGRKVLHWWLPGPWIPAIVVFS